MLETNEVNYVMKSYLQISSNNMSINEWDIIKNFQIDIFIHLIIFAELSW